MGRCTNVCLYLRLCSSLQPPLSPLYSAADDIYSVSTWNAAVGCLEVRDKVLAARLNTEQFSIWHRDGATRPAATSQLHVVEHIGETSDVVVYGQTPADSHATIASRRHQNYFIGARTRSVKRLPLTVFLHRRN